MLDSDQLPHERFVSHLTRNTVAMILAGGQGKQLHPMMPMNVIEYTHTYMSFLFIFALM